MKEKIKTLGIIAGGGNLPERLIQACAAQGTDVFVVGFDGQTQPEIFHGRQHMCTRIGKAGTIISTLKAHGIRDLVFIGGIRRPTLGELRPDMRTAQFFARISLKALGDNGLLGALRGELEREGFTVHGVHKFAQDLLAAPGPIGRHKPKKDDLIDIARGVEVALALGAMDVGQSVIVQEGIVLGVEGAEGTDELLRRCVGYRRKGRGGVLVKICKPGQDRDFDLPTIGPDTVRLAAQTGLAGIAVHAGNALLIDPQVMAQMADEAGLFVTGVSVDGP